MSNNLVPRWRARPSPPAHITGGRMGSDHAILLIINPLSSNKRHFQCLELHFQVQNEYCKSLLAFSVRSDLSIPSLSTLAPLVRVFLESLEQISRFLPRYSWSIQAVECSIQFGWTPPPTTCVPCGAVHRFPLHSRQLAISKKD
jgi:hypothetical protein